MRRESGTHNSLPNSSSHIDGMIISIIVFLNERTYFIKTSPVFIFMYVSLCAYLSLLFLYVSLSVSICLLLSRLSLLCLILSASFRHLNNCTAGAQYNVHIEKLSDLVDSTSGILDTGLSFLFYKSLL